MSYTRKQRIRRKMRKVGVTYPAKSRIQRRSAAKAIERSNTIDHRGFGRGGY